ncbi:thioredoxin [Candidatus Uhrbacteria bacterium CG_4_9_14_3_um_filter_36_7]|uniref:Thioredoxin n=1 Tax=Candidatus Uhrbacteria bacterium CG_4_9_14_3_um_filter_36_7 TaxID=1975033 RepID=A0A2M7XHI0_9BACT|nr:MAG: thioredoxin [Candidatus Uhrbacteria bacterium CG_4_9_14_3_um_filter_36_7]
MKEIVLSTENFDTIISNPDIPVTLVDFWAPWCGPCKMMGPIVESLAEKMTDVQVGTLNVDEYSEIAQKYNILSIPTFMIFKNGNIIDQFSGTMPVDVLENRVRQHLG